MGEFGKRDIAYIILTPILILISNILPFDKKTISLLISVVVLSVSGLLFITRNKRIAESTDILEDISKNNSYWDISRIKKDVERCFNALQNSYLQNDSELAKPFVSEQFYENLVINSYCRALYTFDNMRRKIIEIKPVQVIDSVQDERDKIKLYIKFEYDKYGNESIIDNFKTLRHPLYSEEIWVLKKAMNRWVLEDIINDLNDLLQSESIVEKASVKKFHNSMKMLANGAIYEGELNNGKMNGYGAVTWPNGDKYCGELLDDKRNGQGTYIWSNGSFYQGEWENDYMKGFGIYVDFEGKKQRGYWANSEFQGENEPIV